MTITTNYNVVKFAIINNVERFGVSSLFWETVMMLSIAPQSTLRSFWSSTKNRGKVNYIKKKQRWFEVFWRVTVSAATASLGGLVSDISTAARWKARRVEPPRHSTLWSCDDTRWRWLDFMPDGGLNWAWRSAGGRPDTLANPNNYKCLKMT